MRKSDLSSLVSLQPLTDEELGELEMLRSASPGQLQSRLSRPTPAPFPWANSLVTLGVTGTNGKSSTVHLAASIVESAGHSVLVESTLGYSFGGQWLDVPRTVQGFLQALKHAASLGAKLAIVETTSAALAHGYAKLWRYDHGIFTNLTREHVEAHGSWEHYLASKAQLFVHLGPDSHAILNRRDPASQLLEAVMAPDVRRYGYGLRAQVGSVAAGDLLAESIDVSTEGTLIRLSPGHIAESLGSELVVPLIGEVFAENALAAALGALALKIPPDAIAPGLRRCPTVCGRFEILSRAPLVAIDYAHTPDAIERTCETARRLVPQGQVILVFGAAGGSSSVKRLALGEAAGQGADHVFVTSDNPRNEDPAAIADEVAQGVRRTGHAGCLVELDRSRAIGCALNRAGASDIVVVAGKGHETTQVIGKETRPFSDHAEVRAWLESHSTS